MSLDIQIILYNYRRRPRGNKITPNFRLSVLGNQGYLYLLPITAHFIGGLPLYHHVILLISASQFNDIFFLS